MKTLLVSAGLLWSSYHQATPMIISHRGGMGHYSQASLAAQRYSIKLGIQFIELDLRQTADGGIVVYHDTKINQRLCMYHDGRKISDELVISSMSINDLRQIVCGVTVNPDFPEQHLAPEPILTLDQQLAFINATHDKVKLMFELKHSKTDGCKSFARKVIADINSAGLTSRVTLQSASVPCRRAIARSDANLIDDIVAIPQHLALPIVIRYLQKIDKRVVVFTVNTRTDWQTLTTRKVDGIITDYPRQLQQFLARTDNNLLKH